MTLVEELLAYYKRNSEDFAYDIEELDDLNGFLYEDKIYSMDELDEVLQDVEPSEILRSALFGHDEERGRIRSTFNLDRDYFHFDRLGDIVSTDERDYSDYLKEYFIQEIIDNEDDLPLSNGAREIIANHEDDKDDE